MHLENPIKKPAIMGIINCTPDSYYEPSRCSSLSHTLKKIEGWIEAKAVDIIDIGGESTRPPTPFHQNSSNNTITHSLNPKEEWERVQETLEEILRIFPQIPVSIDTRKFQVAKAALDLGVKYVNVITHDLQDPLYSPFIDLLNEFPHSTMILTHMHGTSTATMQKGPFLASPIMPKIIQWFEEQLKYFSDKSGISSQNRFILDPGIGFGKEKPTQDIEICTHIKELKKLEYPVLVGASRKSFLSEILKGKKSNELLSATLGINSYLLHQGVDILRVHDVLENKEILEVYKTMKVNL